MSLFGEPDNPRWKLLTAAEERLDGALSRDAVIKIVRGSAREIQAIKTLSVAVGRALADVL